MSIDADKLRLLEARMVRVRSPGTSREGFGPPADSNSLKSNQNQTSPLASTHSQPIAVLDQNSNGGGMSKMKQLKRSAPKSAVKPTTTKRPRKLQRGSAGSESVSEEGTIISTSEKNGTAANDQPMASPSDSSSPNRPRTHDITAGGSAAGAAGAAAVESPASAARPIDSFFNKKTSAASSEERTSKKKKSSGSTSSSGVNIPRFVGPSSSSLASISTITSSALASSAPSSALSSMLPPASVSASERMALVERAKLQAKLHKLEQHVVEVTKHAKQTEGAWSTERKRLQGLVTETRGECNQRVNRAAHALENVLRAKAVSDGIQSHLSLATNSHRLGRVVIQRTSTKSVEMWEDGHVFRDLEIAKTAMQTQKVALDARRKELQNKRRSMNRAQKNEKNILNSEVSNDGLLSAGKNTSSSSTSTSSSPSSTSVSTTTTTTSSSSSPSSSSTNNVRQMTETEREQHNAFEELSLASEEEALKIAFDDLKNEEKRIEVDMIRLENEKILHIRETKRMRDEDASRFNCRPVLHQRYLLLRLLGRGGFSEVWEGKLKKKKKKNNFFSSF